MAMRIFSILTIGFIMIILVGCSAPMTTREQGNLIGAELGARTGAIIDSTVDHAAADALIGEPIDLIADALISDQLMGQEQRQQDQQQQMQQNQAELDRLRKENERLKQQKGEW